MTLRVTLQLQALPIAPNGSQSVREREVGLEGKGSNLGKASKIPGCMPLRNGLKFTDARHVQPGIAQLGHNAAGSRNLSGLCQPRDPRPTQTPDALPVVGKVCLVHLDIRALFKVACTSSLTSHVSSHEDI